MVKLDESNSQFELIIGGLVEILSEKNEGYVKTVETLTNFVIIVGDKLKHNNSVDKDIIHKRIEKIISIGNEINKLNNENSYPDIKTFFTGYESENNKIVNDTNMFEHQIPNFIAYISLFIKDKFRGSKKANLDKKTERNAFILIEHTPTYVTDFVNNHKYKQPFRASDINPALHFIPYFNRKNTKNTKITKIMKYLLDFPETIKP